MTAKIKEVKSEDIFIEENSLTNLIKGKKLRKKLYDQGIKVGVEKVDTSMGIGFGLTSPKLVFTFYAPDTLKGGMNDLVLEVSDPVTRVHDIGCRYRYDFYKKEEQA